MSRASDLANLIASGSTTIFGEAGVTSSDSTGKTTNLQQGLAKSWVNLDGTGTVGINDSFNVSSIADDGTAMYDFTHTSNMGNTNTVISGMTSRGSSNGYFVRCDDQQARTTSTIRLVHAAYNTSETDDDPIMALVHGDLA